MAIGHWRDVMRFAVVTPFISDSVVRSLWALIKAVGRRGPGRAHFQCILTTHPLATPRSWDRVRERSARLPAVHSHYTPARGTESETERSARPHAGAVRPWVHGAKAQDMLMAMLISTAASFQTRCDHERGGGW
eukprot:7379411-Prymnesium_polylepis.2